MQHVHEGPGRTQAVIHYWENLNTEDWPVKGSSSNDQCDRRRPTQAVQPREPPNALKSQRQSSHDELGLEMQHAKPQRVEPRIAANISAEPSIVIGPVDFDDEATGWGEKVDDVCTRPARPACETRSRADCRKGEPRGELAREWAERA